MINFLKNLSIFSAINRHLKKAFWHYLFQRRFAALLKYLPINCFPNFSNVIITIELIIFVAKFDILSESSHTPS